MPDLFEATRLGKDRSVLKNVDSANINQINELGRTLLHVAIARERHLLAVQLIARGADVNVQDLYDKSTPLHTAADIGSYEVIKALVDGNADLCLHDRYGNSPLWTAVFHAREFKDGLRIVKLLCKAGADPLHKNVSGRSPLDLARNLEDEELIQCLDISKTIRRTNKKGPREGKKKRQKRS